MSACSTPEETHIHGMLVYRYPHDNKAKGVYVSAIGDLPLFHSDTKFDSGTGCAFVPFLTALRLY